MGDNPVAIAEAVGHTDPSFTLRTYAKATKRRERLTGSYAAEFDRACEWSVLARKGTSEVPAPIEAPSGAPARTPETA
jgi:hypothetical protein